MTIFSYKKILTSFYLMRNIRYMGVNRNDYDLQKRRIKMSNYLFIVICVIIMWPMLFSVPILFYMLAVVRKVKFLTL